MSNLSYEEFSSFSEFDKLSVFDKGAPLVLFRSEKCKRIFLRDVIEKSSNDFFRKRSLECLSLMPIFGESTNYNFSVSVISDIDDSDDEFVVSAKIKYLFLLNEKFDLNDEGIVNQIDHLRFHEKPDVSSQAYYYMGIASLLNANLSNTEVEFFDAVNQAKKYFLGAKSSIENRIDASFLMEVSDLICSLQSSKFEDLEEAISSLSNTLLNRDLLHMNSSTPCLEIWLHKAAISACDIVSSNPSEWLDIKSELNNICCLHYALIDVEMNDLYSPVQEKIASSFSNYVLNPFYKRSLKQHISAINRLCRERPEDKDLVGFLSLLRSSLEGVDSQERVDVKILFCLKEVFPDIPISIIERDVSEFPVGSSDKLANLLLKYKNEYQERPVISATGSHVGDEIFSDIVSKIAEVIPNYNPRKFSEFKLVLSDVIRYSLLAASQKKSGAEFFKFLFTDDAVEDDLQQSMFAFFEMNSSASSRYSLEVDEVSDGGRVDILYSSDSVKFPIELKKTDIKPNKDSIFENYLSQAQTYCYPNDQLGLFVLLDNSSKASEIEKPINDIRELFNVCHMEPYYTLGETAPNYVVSVIVPGNKILPSKRSKYR